MNKEDKKWTARILLAIPAIIKAIAGLIKTIRNKKKPEEKESK